ncbi:MAG: hypothetical protein HYY84_17780 [Deltaproteobacteria bacterium]|nr:hypothetical protein [Deltaproteobacteria bacterium]
MQFRALIAWPLSLIGCTSLGDLSGEYRGAIAAQPLVAFSSEASATMKVEVHRLDALFGTLTVSDGTFSNASLQRVVSFESDRLGEATTRTGALLSFIGTIKVSGGSFAGELATFTISYLSSSRVELRVFLGANKLFGVFNLRKA